MIAYCYYHMDNFQMCVQLYEKLCTLYPEVEEYHVYFAQSLYKSGQYDMASRKASQIESEQHVNQMHLLKASIYYEQNDLKSTRSILEHCLDDDPTTIVFEGAIEFKEGKYEEATKKFQDAMDSLGYQPEIAYNVALCHYKMKQYRPAMKEIAEIIEKVFKKQQNEEPYSKYDVISRESKTILNSV